MHTLIAALIADESGDDLVEYVLLATVIGTAGAVVLQALPAAMGVVYQLWEDEANDLWETPNPQAP